MRSRSANSHPASRPFLSAFRIAVTYALFGVLWILLSDQILAFWLRSPEAMTRAQTVKGWAYVLVTAGLVHSLVRAHLARIAESTRLLQESQNRLEMALRGADLGLWDWDIASGKVVFDERWAAMLGYPLAELRPEIATWEDAVHPEDKEIVLGAMTAHLEGRSESFEAEHRLRTKEGSWRWILAKGRIVERDRQNQPMRVSGTHLDIDARKQAELEWTRLGTAVEQAAEMVFITDTEGAIQYVNPAFERITGYSAGEALGQTTQFLKSGKHDSEFYATIWQTLSGGDIWSGRISNKRKNGSLIEEEASISPIRDREGRIGGYVAVMRDVTEQIELEEQLRQSQKMEAVGQLAGGIAHDFNNLLQAILGYTSMALDALPPEHCARHDLDQALEAAQRASSLIRQLLLFSRRQEARAVSLDLNQAIAQLMKMLRRIIGEHIELEIRADRELRPIYADRGQIEQILINLCVNARDAMPEGGRLSIETMNARLSAEPSKQEGLDREADYVMLCVRDTGGGIPQAIQKRIFEPFFTTKEVGKGTGMGLATVYGIVQQHQGWIELHSEPGQGAEFRIYLPASDLPPAEELLTARSASPSRESKTILLAEDEELVHRLAVKVLQQAGYEVLAAHDGKEAIQVFDKNRDRIGLAILDAVMPGLGGKAVYEHIHRVNPSIPILFSSGYSFDVLQAEYLPEGDVQVLQKPYAASELLNRIGEMLNRAEDRSQAS